jgi:hypothetical protein
MSIKCTCILQGGLGNQLFIIWAARCFAQTNHFSFALYPYLLGTNQINKHSTKNYIQILFPELIVNTKWDGNTKMKFYNEPAAACGVFQRIPVENIYSGDMVVLKGYFQSAKYYKTMEEWVRCDMQRRIQQYVSDQIQQKNIQQGSLSDAEFKTLTTDIQRFNLIDLHVHRPHLMQDP